MLARTVWPRYMGELRQLTAELREGMAGFSAQGACDGAAEGLVLRVPRLSPGYMLFGQIHSPCARAQRLHRRAARRAGWSNVAFKPLPNQTTGSVRRFRPRVAALGGNLLADFAWHVKHY